LTWKFYGNSGFIFGYGLSWGSEYYTLEQLVGSGPYLELYASFKDPQTATALGRKEYPFMAYGPISPLSISGKPIFFGALHRISKRKQF